MSNNFDHRDTPLPHSYYKRQHDVSRVTLWRYRKAGLPAVEVGAKIWIKESDFLAFVQKMNGQTVSAVSLKNREDK